MVQSLIASIVGLLTGLSTLVTGFISVPELPAATQGAAAAGVPSIVHGTLPTDWYLSKMTGSNDANWMYLFPDVDNGERHSGTVTIQPLLVPTSSQAPTRANLNGVTYRLLVDGVPQPSFTINTRNWSDGTHVLGMQVMSASYKIENGSRIVVFNNSGVPVLSKADQAVVGPYFGSRQFTSLAWARVNVLEPQAYPLGHPRATHPLPTEADGQRLATGNNWWLEGLTHQGTGLYSNFPMLVKNRQGDYFISQWNPQHTIASVGGWPSVKASPQFDGPRGIGWLSPYATLVPGKKILNSGYRGWIGVDISGRVVDVDLTGEIRTIFGPRSVANAVQTDPYLHSFTLDQRIAAGEKEFVGSGERLVMPQDLALLDDDIILIADTGANKVSRVSRSQARIVSSNPCPGVSSVWVGFGAEWWACKDSLWKYVNGTATKFATIPNAFWVRGDEGRGSLYVLTDEMALYEVNPSSGATTIRRAPAGKQEFVFLEVDVKGNAGPKGRIYFSMSGSFRSNTGINYMDPGVWEEKTWAPRIQNMGNFYVSQQATNDIFGHYLWGFSIHPDEAMWVSTGVSNSSWKIATGHLGPLPPLDAAIQPTTYGVGHNLTMIGKRDEFVGLGSIFGANGHGGLGYSVDTLRNSSVADFRNLLDPLLSTGTSDADRNAIATFMWAQRSRAHFPAGVAHTHPAATVNLSASPTSLTAPGSVTLTWSSTNATSCTTGGGWSGSKATSGTESVSVSANTTFALTCTGQGGGGSRSVTISVAGTTPPPAPAPTPVPPAPTPQPPPAPVTSTLQIVSITGPFTYVNSCGTLTVGGSCKLTIIFKPTGPGVQSGVLTLKDTLTGRVRTIPLSGIGKAVVAPAPQPTPPPPTPQPAPAPVPAPAPTPPAPSPTSGTIPTSVAGMAPGTWFEVPNSKLQSVLPPASVTDALRCFGSVIGITNSWNSGVYDTKRDRMIITGGGHCDYSGNEFYAFDLNTLKWTRLNDPSSPVGMVPNGEVMPDGKPVQRHTYDGIEYMPNVDRFFSQGGSLATSGHGSLRTWFFDFDTLTWERKADAPTTGYGNISAYDPVRGTVIFHAGATASLLEYNPTNNTWVTRGTDPGVDIYKVGAIAPDRRVFVATGNNATLAWKNLDATTVTYEKITTTGPKNVEAAYYPGFDYDLKSKNFVAWTGGSDVYTLNPDTWTWTRHSAAAGNTATPPPDSRVYNGVFNRWRYVPSMSVFVLVTTIGQNVYIYKPNF